jgi:xylulokinase
MKNHAPFTGSRRRVLALDVGTSSVKAGYWDGGRFTATARAALQARLRETHAEIPPAAILAAVEHAAREVLRGQPAPDVIAFDAFSSAVVITDDRGRPTTNIITHQDRRSVRSAQEIIAEFTAPWLLRRLGNLPFPGGIGNSTLRWLATHTRALRGNFRVGQLSCLLARHFTGRWVIDPSQATFLGLMDIRTRTWCPEICDFLGLPESALPRIEFADEVLGMTLPALSRRWGIQSGTPVIGGFVDTSSAVLNTPMHPGQLVHSAGSTDVLALCVARPQPAAHLLTRPVGVGRILPPRWLAVSTIASSGSAIDWVRRLLFPETNDAAFRALMRRAARPRPGTAVPGLAVPAITCEPWFAGDRTSIPQKTATLSGLTLGATRDDILAAIIAGLTQTSAARYHHLSRVHPIARAVYTMGGATDLSAAMHRAWRGRHRFAPIPGDALAGLVTLAGAVLGA